MTYESSDIPVKICPSCGAVLPEGVEFVYQPEFDEYVCAECAINYGSD